jgi:hypothetical protein
MSGEIPGVREAGERLRERLRDSSLPREWSEKKVRDAVDRADRRIRDGAVPKPR